MDSQAVSGHLWMQTGRETVRKRTTYDIPYATEETTKLNLYPDYAVNSTNLLNTNPGSGQLLRYGHIEDMETCLAEHHGRVAAVIIEALHGKLP